MRPLVLFLLAILIVPTKASSQLLTAEDIGVCFSEDLTSCEYAYRFNINESETFALNENMTISANFSMANGEEIDYPEGALGIERSACFSPDGENFYCLHLSGTTSSSNSEIDFLQNYTMFMTDPQVWQDADTVYMQLMLGFDYIVDSIYSGVSIRTDTIAIPNQANLTVGIAEQEKARFRAYPNPFTNELTIESDTPVEIFDITGNRVAIHNPNDRFLSTDTFSSGVYFARKEDGQTIKIVKN